MPALLTAANTAVAQRFGVRGVEVPTAALRALQAAIGLSFAWVLHPRRLRLAFGTSGGERGIRPVLGLTQPGRFDRRPPAMKEARPAVCRAGLPIDRTPEVILMRQPVGIGLRSSASSSSLPLPICSGSSSITSYPPM